MNNSKENEDVLHTEQVDIGRGDTMREKYVKNGFLIRRFDFFSISSS